MIKITNEIVQKYFSKIKSISRYYDYSEYEISSWEDNTRYNRVDIVLSKKGSILFYSVFYNDTILQQLIKEYEREDKLIELGIV